MVFLDQKGVIQANAVVVAAAAQHGVLLGGAKTGKGLAGVQNGDPGASDGIRVAACGGGGAHQGLQEIQGGALTGKDLAGIAVESAQGGVRSETVTVGHVPLDVNVTQLAEHLISPGGATHDGAFPRDDGGFTGAVIVDQLGGDVPFANVFFQRKGHISGDVITEVFGQGLGHGGVSLGVGIKSGPLPVLLQHTGEGPSSKQGRVRCWGQGRGGEDTSDGRGC